MKKALVFCLTLFALPGLMADTGFATLTKQEQRKCERRAEKRADERALGNTVGGAVRSSQRWKDYYWKKYKDCVKKYD